MPTVQARVLIERFATFSVLPLRSGTTQFLSMTLKVTVTVAFTSSVVTVQAPLPEQPSPVQPANVERGAGVAVSLTRVPGV